MKFSTVLVGIVLALAACGGNDSTDVVDRVVLDDTTTTFSTGTTVEPTGPAPTTVAPDSLRDVDLATYVASLEDALAGTAYEGEVLRSPEVFVATGTLFCDQLDSGSTPDEVMTQYVETLTDGRVEQAADDDLALAGGMLGVGVATLCPHHVDVVAGSS